MSFYRLQRSYKGYVLTPVCHSVQKGEGVSVHAGIRPPPGTRHPLRTSPPPDQTPPRTRHPRDQAPPGRGTLRGPGTPQTRHPSGSRDGYCSGWYASYWNAFLFIFKFVISSWLKCLVEICCSFIFFFVTAKP